MLDQLTRDITDALRHAPQLQGVPVFDQIREESEDAIANALAWGLASAGLASGSQATGLAVLVETVKPESANPNIGVPVFELGLRIHCVENPGMNGRAAQGLNVTWLAMTVAELLVGWIPDARPNGGGRLITLQSDNPWEASRLVPDKDVDAGDMPAVELRFNLGPWAGEGIALCEHPVVTWDTDTGVLTCTCGTAGAVLWVTTSTDPAVEPELPRPEAATAVRYVPGMTVAEGTIVRVAAVAEGKRGSHTLRFVAGE